MKVSETLFTIFESYMHKKQNPIQMDNYQQLYNLFFEFQINQAQAILKDNE